MLKLGTALALAFCLTFPIWAQQATVERNVHLRPTPSNEGDSIRRLLPPEALTLLEPNPTDGYYRVRAAEGDEGWVWGRNIEIGPVTEGTYATNDPSCPPVGKYKKDGVLYVNSPTSNKGMLSMAKRKIPSGTARTLTFDDFALMQSLTETAFSYDARAKKLEIVDDREGLQELPLPGGAISEGDHVRLAGYVTEARSQGAEAVNCYDSSQKDIHINIAPETADRHEGIVVEMIPQLPAQAGWTTSVLNRLHKQQILVMVVGGLTYDNEHRVNDRPTQPIGGQPWRFSLWEIHPVTQVYVCEIASCSPEVLSEWVTLSAWAANKTPLPTK